MRIAKKQIILLLMGIPAFFAYSQDVEIEGNLLVQGKMGIGFDTYPANRLEVDGTVRAKEVAAYPENWPDFVFEKDYGLPGLEEVEAHIKELGRLPDIPPASLDLSTCPAGVYVVQVLDQQGISSHKVVKR